MRVIYSVKQCSKCHITKEKKDFYKRSASGDGLSPKCKNCIKEEQKTRGPIYYQKNKEIIRAKHREWHEKNKKSVSERKTKCRRLNPEKAKKQQQEYRKKNKERIKKYHTEYNKRDYVRFTQACRSRIREALKNKSKKAFGTEELLGCSIKELKSYLELKFEDGMNWQNFGDWHIDHIKPCSSFDLSKESEQKKCFHYTNLQPLWKHDNLSKGSKY